MNRLALSMLLILAAASPLRADTDLQVSSNGHYLQRISDGTAFYWMGDTGWLSFNRLNRTDAVTYLNDRQSKGITVLQTMVHASWSAGGTGAGPTQDNPVNPYGHLPFNGTTSNPDTASPLVVSGGSPDSPNDYWDHADFIVRETKNRGMHLAIAPTWGALFINSSNVEYTEAEAESYGRFLGDRYKNEPHIIWILGGDIDANYLGDKQAVYRAMAEGIAEGVSGLAIGTLTYNVANAAWSKVLMTYHPPGDLLAQTTVWFHGDLWLDFDMMQSGQQYPDNVTPLTDYYYGTIESSTVKPVVMGECLYEGYIHWDENYPGNAAIDVRRSIYQSCFAGSRGYTYGTASSTAAVDITTLDDVWAFGSGGAPTGGHGWMDRLPESATPGSFDLQHVNSLLTTRAWQNFAPDQTIISGVSNPADRYQKRACKSANEILVYFATNSSANIQNTLGTAATAQWFNPDTGVYQSATAFNAGQTQSMQPPVNWADAVLVLTANGGTQAPYPGPNPASVPGTIQAENFDSGGQNVSYYDVTSSNLGGQYRTSEMVDIATCTDTGGGYSLGWNPAGEWVEYTVSVASSGSYNLSFRVACVGTGNTFRMEVDGTNVTGMLSCPDTGGWQTWQNTTPVAVNLTAGTHVLKFVSVNGTGFGVNYFTLTAGAGLPSPWLNQDIGTVSAAGSASYSGGTFTVTGSGADIWGTGDEFQYVYQPVTGDCTIVARVASQSYANDWAKSGVMIRDTSATGGKNAFMFKIPLNNQIVAQHRTTTDGATAQPSISSGAASYWVKLIRTGNSFTFYKSTDNSNWGSALATQTITMSNTVNVGLAVTSHADGTLCTTTFDNVTVTGGSGYTSVKDWNFNTDGNQEGWTLTRCTATVAGGDFTITATATDPLVKSPSSLGITSPATYNKIRIRMKNNSVQTSAAASFITTADQTWGTNGKWVQFTITANSDYTDYVLDMSTIPAWTGTIHQIRIDPLDPAVSGQVVNLDYVRITN